RNRPRDARARQYEEQLLRRRERLLRRHRRRLPAAAADDGLPHRLGRDLQRLSRADVAIDGDIQERALHDHGRGGVLTMLKALDTFKKAQGGLAMLEFA